jgi:hypothetical protein
LLLLLVYDDDDEDDDDLSFLLYISSVEQRMGWSKQQANDMLSIYDAISIFFSYILSVVHQYRQQ